MLQQKSIADKHIKEQETINSVLKLSLSSDSVEVHLQRKLDVILEHFSQKKGCIFLYNKELKMLQIAAHRGFSDSQLALCSSVPEGKCLCGMAASTKEVVFCSDCKDEKHDIAYEGMTVHGQYCVPIVSTDKQADRLLGVINLYVDAGWQRNDEDEVFIKNIASIIAGVILRKQELQLIELDRTESLTTLAAGIAHEINNPLSFIKSSVSSLKRNLGIMEHYVSHTRLALQHEPLSEESIDLLKEYNIDSKISMMHNKINSSDKGVERIMEVVNGLRTFSRLNKADVEEVDINKCIDEALSVCLHENDKVRIVKEYVELPPLLCEPRAMNQCFYHIIQNAAQAIAAANNAGTIWIVTSRLCDPIGKTEKIQIKIEDDGAGMSEEAVKRAFVPFFTTKEVGSGKGLGLSMVDGIIQRQGGTVALESTEGKGTSVTITLPLLQNKMFYR